MRGFAFSETPVTNVGVGATTAQWAVVVGLWGGGLCGIE